MLNTIKSYWDTHPLIVILIAAGVVRLLATIFSLGYGMHDDHFLVIDIAQKWIHGSSEWFNEGPVIRRGLLYPGLHYLLFWLLKNMGITDPQLKMFIVRLIHASYSMLIVLFGYLISIQLTDKKTSSQIGLILALFWILPFLSVRCLLEMVCIPPLMIGFYFALKNKTNNRDFKYWILSGIFFGLAVTLRFQTAVFVAGLGMVLLFQKRWKESAWYSAGFIFSVFILLGVVDWIAWGVPFSSIYNYVIYNYKEGTSYVVGPWYSYTLLIIGLLIPPLSIMFSFGFLKTWKKYAIIFWPSFLFFFFHSYFPNKQERFILPFLPFIIILGAVGWAEFVINSSFWKQKKKLLKGIWIWFWVINCLLLIIFTFTYSKKNRVESLSYLSHKNYVTGVVWESHLDEPPLAPLYYLNKSVPVYPFGVSKSFEELNLEILSSGYSFPNYIILLGESGIEKRVINFETYFSKTLKLEKIVAPSLIDDILFTLNPKRNVNQKSYIYKIN